MSATPAKFFVMPIGAAGFDTIDDASAKAKADALGGITSIVAETALLFRPVKDPVECVDMRGDQAKAVKKEKALKPQSSGEETGPSPDEIKAAAEAAESQRAAETLAAQKIVDDEAEKQRQIEEASKAFAQSPKEAQPVVKSGDEFGTAQEKPVIVPTAQNNSDDYDPFSDDNDTYDLLNRRVMDDPNGVSRCPRCGGTISRALAGKETIWICNKEGCRVQPSAISDQKQLARLMAVVNAEEPGYTMVKAGVMDAKEDSPPLPTEWAGPIPDEASVVTAMNFLGISIPLPPDDWSNEPITKENSEPDENGEVGGGQCKALNTVLSASGFGDPLRHKAVSAILNRAITSLSDLTKAEAHICLTWLEKAQPVNISELGKACGKAVAVRI